MHNIYNYEMGREDDDKMRASNFTGDLIILTQSII